MCNVKNLKTLQEAIEYFSSPKNCLDYIIPLRWKDGEVTCPRCASKEHYFVETRSLWQCKGCKRQFTVKIGTIMEDSPLPLKTWLAAIWLITNAKNGISSYEIHRSLGITQKSAWFVLQRIRFAMHNGSFEMLSGDVEADETYIGGKARNMHKEIREEKIQGRGASGKSIVIGLLERGTETKASRVKAKVAKDTKKETLQRNIQENVELGATVYTDENPSYEGIDGYMHEKVNHAADEYVRGKATTNGMENFWTLFKRTIKGTYVSVEPFHLFRYIDEQQFRFNERKKTDGERFVDVVANITGKRLTYKKLIGKIDISGLTYGT